uniref:Uncharacterized protein n=1 Tax=Ascaris lumbricoides TaxID=6252 RepID=A0A0M3IB00_ASCLU
MSQSSIGDSIEELIHKLRNQLFISTDLSPQRIEKEMEKAVQNFFMQILPPTFLCMTTGPCRSVTQSYANCLRNNSPSWKTFYGTEPKEMAAKLRTAILKYRIIEKTIDKLHRSVVEIEAINITCIARFTAVVYCGLECSKLEGSGSPVGYCSDACTNAVRNCLGESATDWDSFVTILRKLSIDFDNGFSEVIVVMRKASKSVVEIEAINITCIARFTAVVYCGLECSKLEGSGSPVGYCSDACTNAVRNCLGESATDWDSFVTILRKLSIDFDNGFSELERGVIASVSHAVEVEAPAIAKVVLKKCGPASASKSTLSNRTLEYNKPIAVQRKLVGMIRKFTSYVGWWQRLSQNVCSDASRMSTCWNGTALISRLILFIYSRHYAFDITFSNRSRRAH